MVEALVAARRDEDVARPMRDYVGERADWLADLMRLAQAGGELDPALSPNALAHFCLLLAMGSALVTPDLHAVGDEEWAALLTRVAAALAPDASCPRGCRAGQQQPRGQEQPVKVQIDPGRCQGHGRCYDLAPGLFGDDDEGYGQVLGDGTVPPGQEQRRAPGGRQLPGTARSSSSRRSDMTVDDRFAQASASRPTTGRSAPAARSSPARSPTGRPTSPTSSRSGPPIPTRSRTTCGSAARSRTPSGSAAHGCRPATRTSRRSPTTPSTSPRGRSS